MSIPRPVLAFKTRCFVKALCFLLLTFLLAGCAKKENNPSPKPKHAFVNSLFRSNMVVQSDKPFSIWGIAAPNSKLTVMVSWSNTTLTTTADGAGNWTIAAPAAAATFNPQTITVMADGFDAVMLTNILIGDVWICSGQSNMAMPLDSVAPFEGVINYKAEIAAANYPAIRVLSLQDDKEYLPLDTLKFPVTWSICSPSVAGKVSAVAYYFARKLTTTLNVPVGIIIAADNGSFCQDWANKEAIESDPLLSKKYLSGSSSLYNGMINPLINLTVKGFIWYQGENNEDDSPVSNYTLLNSALIKGWRTKFNQAGFPFYYVQLAPFAADYETSVPPGGDPTLNDLAKFREAQANILNVPATGMAITMDVGEANNHHPRNKQPVGERLALLALKNTYNQNVVCNGPHYSSFSANGYLATVNFAPGTADGLNTIGNAPLNQYFFVAGTDQVFRKGIAVISGNNITITAPQNTPLPIQAVRYAFTNAPITNLQNAASLPAEPFRTDSWAN